MWWTNVHTWNNYNRSRTRRFGRFWNSFSRRFHGNKTPKIRHQTKEKHKFSKNPEDISKYYGWNEAKFHTVDPQKLSATVQNSFARTNWRLRFSHPCQKIFTKLRSVPPYTTNWNELRIKAYLSERFQSDGNGGRQRGGMTIRRTNDTWCTETGEKRWQATR